MDSEAKRKERVLELARLSVAENLAASIAGDNNWHGLEFNWWAVFSLENYTRYLERDLHGSRTRDATS
jgi:hypothetical protein